MTQSGPPRGDREREIVALNLAGGGGDPTAEDLLQRRKITMIRARILLVLGCMVVGAAIGFASSHPGATTSRGWSVAHWRAVAGPALLNAGLLLETVVVVARFRSGQFKAGWRSPSLVLSRRQRRQLLRQIRGKGDVDQVMLPVSRRLAVLVRNQRSMIGLFIALPMIFLGQALPHNVPLRWWLAILMSVAYAALTVPILRDSRLAEKFLLEHARP